MSPQPRRQKTRSKGGPKVLRILAISDLRVQNLPTIIEWVRARRKPLDLILYAGDDIHRFHPEPGQNRFAELATLTQFGLCAVAGNDDGPQVRELITGKRVYNVDRRALKLGRFVIIGQEGAPIIPNNANMGHLLYDDATCERRLNRRIRSREGRTVIVLSHAPPLGCLDMAMRFGRASIGSWALATAIRDQRAIRLVVCGHVHLMGGRHTRTNQATVVNAASHDYPGEPAKAAVITVEHRGTTRVRWHTITSRHLLGAVSGIGPGHARHLAKAGIRNMRVLAAASPKTVAAALGWKRTKAVKGFIARAQAHVQQAPVVFGDLALRGEPRVYFDIETDLDHSYVWLIGCYDEKTKKFVRFFAQRPSEELAVLKAFTRYVNTRRGHTLVSFSGTDFDRQVTSARLQVLGLEVPEPLRKAVDVMHPIRNAVAFPVHGCGLKELASTVGYRFRHRDLDGLGVALEYMACVRTGRTVPKKLLRYNEDDVRGLRHLVLKTEELVRKNR